MRILLVDDHPELRRATRDLLEASGHEVRDVPGPAAARAAFDRPFDLLLTDLHMPAAAEGLELAREARAARPALPVLIASSDVETLTGVELPGSGPTARLAKPFVAERLGAAIDALGRGESVETPTPIRSTTRTGPASTKPASNRSSFRRTGPVLAVAAVVLVALATALLWSPAAPPELPAPPVDDVRRGAVIEIVSPSGPLAGAPSVLRWRGVADADRYRVEVLDALEETVFDETALVRAADVDQLVDELVVELPGELRDRLVPHAAYHWRVEALDAAGSTVAASPAVRFRIIPSSPDDF